MMSVHRNGELICNEAGIYDFVGIGLGSEKQGRKVDTGPGEPRAEAGQEDLPEGQGEFRNERQAAILITRYIQTGAGRALPSGSWG